MKFKDTKVFKVLKSKTVQAIITKIPFGIGSLVSDIVTPNDAPEGELTKEKLINNLVKIGIYVILISLALTGNIEWDDAEKAKSFVN